ncbi:CCT4 [Bugula neritina]|uniref:T-complex protein 1 subunit delta n=1 Tax=Bugula neritina TaxID=10212 RepID=A0A7J7K9V8_BUGNE|nr:CCT4 [Bugula neritina]
MKLLHPAARMLVELSKAQDIEAGDGTTSVVVIAGALLDASSKLLAKGIHPTTISDAFQEAAKKGCEILEKMSNPVQLNDKESLLKSASTSLNSKVVSQYSSVLSPIIVDAVLRVIDPAKATNVDLKDIRVMQKLGFGFFLHIPPKTDMENNVVISDYTQMDRIMKEERQYILNIVKTIKKSGCNMLLIQKSILRDAVNDLALHFLAKLKIMVVKDIEREDIEFICKGLGCKPIASLDHFTADMLGSAELVEEMHAGSSKIVKVTGVQNPGRVVSVIVRGSNKLVLEEAERSIHDALCVIRCLVKKRALIAGGGAPETELSIRLREHADTLSSMQQYCFRAYADALEVVPFTLAENAGLNPIATVTELRNRHANGEIHTGINVRKGMITNILDENVVQPLLVSTSAITLASETVRSIMKIDDIVNVMGR